MIFIQPNNHQNKKNVRHIIFKIQVMDGKKTQEDRKCQTLTGFFFFYFLAPVNELSKPSLFAGKKIKQSN